MDSMPPAPHVVPNSRIPKVIGILNIVFASALMICGLCTMGYYAMIPFWARAMQQMQAQAEAKDKAQKEAELEALAAQEKAATTDEEKADILEQRKKVEDRPKVLIAGTMDLKSMGLEAPQLKAYVIAEFATGFVLNLLMLTSGIGLVRRRLWGVSLGLWSAALKLVRLPVLYGYAAVVIAPAVSQAMANGLVEAMTKQQAAMGKPLPPSFNAGELGRVYAVMFTAYFVGMIVVGAIYPAISLWLLSRPAARAACSSSGKLMGPDETW